MPISLPITVELTWKKIGVISSSAIVASAAIIAGTWEIRKDYIDSLKTEIAAFKETEHWKVPETIQQLGAISEKLNNQMTFKDEYERLKGEQKTYAATKAQLTNDLSSSKKENLVLKEKIESLSKELKSLSTTPREMTLTGGESIELVKNKIVLGIDDVYSGFVSIRINNEDTRNLYVGNNRQFDVRHETCTLTVTKISKPNVTFSFRCGENDPTI